MVYFSLLFYSILPFHNSLLLFPSVFFLPALCSYFGMEGVLPLFPILVFDILYSIFSSSLCPILWYWIFSYSIFSNLRFLLYIMLSSAIWWKIISRNFAVFSSIGAFKSDWISRAVSMPFAKTLETSFNFQSNFIIRSELLPFWYLQLKVIGYQTWKTLGIN